MKLNSFGCGIFFVSDAHNFSVVGFRGNFQTFREIFPGDGQRVIAHGLEGFVNALIDHFSIPVDHGCLAMHEPFGGHHFPTKSGANGLVAEAYAEDRDPAREMFHHRQRNSRCFRSTRSG